MKPLIMVVDDEPVNRMILTKTFSDTDYRTKECASGEEAIAFLEDEVPDIILLDIMMPGIDGFEVCEKIKSNPRTFDIPVIIITALSDKISRLRGLQLGAADIITKPFDLPEIRLKVNLHLKMRNLYLEVKKHNENIKKDILAARKLQMNLLPENNVDLNENYHFSYEYYPCDSLGGDFLDIFPLDDDTFCFYIADVSGHGVASSLVTIFLKEFFNQNRKKIKDTYDPGQILTLINKALININFEDRYMTLFVGLVNVKTNKLNWASAGPNTTPILFSKDSISFLENQAMAIGWLMDLTWDSHELDIPEDSFLMFYSDAAVELKNPMGDVLNAEGLLEMLKACNIHEHGDFQLVIQYLMEYSEDVSFQDDLSLVGLRRK